MSDEKQKKNKTKKQKIGNTNDIKFIRLFVLLIFKAKIMSNLHCSFHFSLNVFCFPAFLIEFCIVCVLCLCALFGYACVYVCMYVLSVVLKVVSTASVALFVGLLLTAFFVFGQKIWGVLNSGTDKTKQTKQNKQKTTKSAVYVSMRWIPHFTQKKKNKISIFSCKLY